MTPFDLLNHPMVNKNYVPSQKKVRTDENSNQKLAPPQDFFK